MFEWAPGIHVLYETQEEATYMINEDKLEVEDIAINNGDDEQEECEDEKGLGIIE